MRDHQISEDEELPCSVDDSCLNGKQVRIVEENLTLTYNPRSYSMPDLLEIDNYEESYHKHPNIQLSTHLSNSVMDVRSTRPKKSSNFKQRFANGFKYFKNSKTTDKTKNSSIHSRDELGGLPNGNQKLDGSSNHRPHKLLQPFISLNIFHRHDKTSPLQRSKTSPSHFEDCSKK